MASKGKVFKFGDNITTDHITPGRLMHLRSNLPELAKHAMEEVDPTFVNRVRPGDFVVGGRNFGLGSSREHAPIVLKMLGVAAVLVKSSARIFFRNCINVGLPIVVCDTEIFNDGDEIEVDLETSTARDLTNGSTLTFGRIPETMLRILEEGGLAPYIQKHGDFPILGPE
jgi:3-isopropylmalate/(R)-2-methylmalate dehydratase small subunit